MNIYWEFRQGIWFSIIYLNIYKSDYVIVSNMGDRFWQE